MKRAGEYLGAIIDANLYSKAKTYSGFFSSWGRITQICGVDAAGAHSRVRELEKGVLVVEADHPGWVQILQTKASQIIGVARRLFPELDIRGVSFTLSKPRPGAPEAPATEEEPPGALTAPGNDEEEEKIKTWEQLGDSDLKDSLKRLEKSIRDRERASRRRAGKTNRTP
jgi:hypothetical protein